MPNISYLLGAGASAEALPVVSQMNSHLVRFQQILLSKGTVDGKYHEAADQLSGDIGWLIRESSHHQTIDTLAKKLFIVKDRTDDLRKLKKVLSVFFVYEQTYKTPPGFTMPGREKRERDSRYDSFIASIIGETPGELDLPANIRVITWNYDLQMELAFAQYSGETISQIQKRWNCLPSRYRFYETDNDHSERGFTVVRLNGCAGLGSLEKRQEPAAPTAVDAINLHSNKLQAILEYYQRLSAEPYDPAYAHCRETDLMNFAWENALNTPPHTSMREAWKAAESIMADTEILVIIGYSFPFFNKKYDDRLLQSFFSKSKPGKIYLQDTNAPELAAKLSAAYPGKIKYGNGMSDKTMVELAAITYTGQFFIPEEFG